MKTDFVGEVQKTSKPAIKGAIKIIFDPENVNFALDFQFSLFRQQSPRFLVPKSGEYMLVKRPDSGQEDRFQEAMTNLLRLPYRERSSSPHYCQ